MNILRLIAPLAAISCLQAQNPDAKPLLSPEEIQRLLLSREGKPSDQAKDLFGGGNTNRFFYFPTHDEPATPATWGFRYENVDFKSTDGTNLHGWFIPSRAKQPKGTVVFSHGNAGSLGYHLGFVMWLA